MTFEEWLYYVRLTGSFPEQDALNIARQCFDIDSRGGSTCVRHQVSVYYNMKHCHCARCETNKGKRIKD
jgi:hypothetical protein